MHFFQRKRHHNKEEINSKSSANSYDSAEYYSFPLSKKIKDQQTSSQVPIDPCSFYTDKKDLNDFLVTF